MIPDRAQEYLRLFFKWEIAQKTVHWALNSLMM